MSAPGALRLLLGLGLALAGATSVAQIALPGTLQAESYASMSGVVIEATTDTGGGGNVGWIDANDYMTYSVNPSSAGWYSVQYRVASVGTTGQLVLSQNSTDITPATSVPNTGGWQSWRTITSRVYLAAGAQNLSLFAKGGGFNLNWINFAKEGNTALPAIRQSGRYWVDANGARVNLRGVNLGNWLAMEMWMMGSSIVHRQQQRRYRRPVHAREHAREPLWHRRKRAPDERMARQLHYRTRLRFDERHGHERGAGAVFV